MLAKSWSVLIFSAACIAGCDFGGYRDSVFERTLPEGCGKKCFRFAETDQARGAVGKDGMRVYVEPSFGAFDYRFEIVPQPGGCVIRWPEEEFDEAKNYCTH